MKKFLSLLLVCLMVFGLVACGGSQSNNTPANNTPANNTPANTTPANNDAASTVEYDKVTLTLAHGAAETTTLNDAALKFKELVEQKSGGNITVEVYPNQQMGGDREYTEAVAQGNLSMGAPSTSNMVGQTPSMYTFDSPFVFTNREDQYAALDSAVGQQLLDAVREGGLQGLTYWENGFRDLTTNREIKTLADFKGLKIRVMENEVHLAIWSALGANPSPLAFGELYTALQQKTFDAQENPLELIYNTKFYEVQPYVYLTNHIYTAYLCFMNAGLYDSLNADTQALVKECAVEATAYQRTLCEAASNKCADEINASGKSHTYDVDPALLADIQGSLGDVYALVKEKSGIPDLVEAYYNAL